MINLYYFMSKFCSRKSRNSFVILIIANILLAISLIYEPEIIRTELNLIKKGNKSEILSTIPFILIISVLNILLSSAIQKIKIKTQNLYQIDLSESLLTYLMNFKKAELDKKTIGDLNNIITDNSIKFSSFAISSIVDFFAGIVVILLVLIYMFLINSKLLLCILISYSIIRLLLYPMERFINSSYKNFIKINKESSNFAFSLLKNMMIFRIFDSNNFLQFKFHKNEKEYMRKSCINFAWVNAQQDLVWAAAKVVEFIVIGISLFIIGENVEISTILSFIISNDILNNGIYQFSLHWSEKETALALKESLEKFLLNENKEEGESDIEINENFEISFRNVTFSYGKRKILKNINFSINPGEKILITGKNGEGKSSLLKLICGLYRPDSGEIKFNNLNISNLHISNIAKYCSFISQFSNMLDLDINSNIAFCDNYDSNFIYNCMKEMNMLSVKNNDINSLSQGEKQRINICRSFYKFAVEHSGRFVILADEIFSNIDVSNRYAVIKLFKEYFEQSTIIMISHEEIPFKFNRIFHIENGELIEKRIKNE